MKITQMTSLRWRNLVRASVNFVGTVKFTNDSVINYMCDVGFEFSISALSCLGSRLLLQADIRVLYPHIS